MRELTAQEIADPRAYYASHHGVTRPGKKIRVVNNLSMKADAKVPGGPQLSLNDCLMVGPVIQTGLADVLTNWRTYRTAWTADIDAMFKQIRIAEEDQIMQRMVFRDSPKDRIRHYALTTVSFGAASSPFQAQACVAKLGEDIEKKEPNIANILKNEIYMDDIFAGADDPYQAQWQMTRTKEVLAKAGFPLSKFAANDLAALAKIPEKCHKPELSFDDEGTELKTLGLHWNPVKDTFGYQVHEDTSVKDTKREFASKSAAIYDPLGLLTPVIMPLRKAIQEIWPLEGKMDWDEELPDDIQKMFNKFKSEAKLLTKIKVERWIGLLTNETMELIGFSDASKKAYGYCIYAKTSKGTFLIRAGCRVVSRKNPPTLPRLELEAAALLARVIGHLKELFKGRVSGVRCFTDNSAVVAWIKNIRTGGIIFVRNRVNTILKHTRRDDWDHVAGGDNPADLTTRGKTPRNLL